MHTHASSLTSTRFSLQAEPGLSLLTHCVVNGVQKKARFGYQRARVANVPHEKPRWLITLVRGRKWKSLMGGLSFYIGLRCLFPNRGGRLAFCGIFLS